LNSLII